MAISADRAIVVEQAEWPDAVLPGKLHRVITIRSVDALEAMAMTLIVRARDASGARLFAKAERMELMNQYEPDVLVRIVGEMNGGTESATLEAAEGN